MGALYIVPKIGAMKNLRLSIHSDQHQHLREVFIIQRKSLGLSQRALAERLGVVYSFVSKVETGDRRLDVFEFIIYCQGLQLDPLKVLMNLQSTLKVEM